MKRGALHAATCICTLCIAAEALHSEHPVHSEDMALITAVPFKPEFSHVPETTTHQPPGTAGIGQNSARGYILQADPGTYIIQGHFGALFPPRPALNLAMGHDDNFVPPADSQRLSHLPETGRKVRSAPTDDLAQVSGESIVVTPLLATAVASTANPTVVLR